MATERHNPTSSPDPTSRINNSVTIISNRIPIFAPGTHTKKLKRGPDLSPHQEEVSLQSNPNIEEPKTTEEKNVGSSTLGENAKQPRGPYIPMHRGKELDNGKSTSLPVTLPITDGSAT